MTEKKRPTYSLEAFQAASEQGELLITSTAIKTAAELGFGRSDINEVIQTMESQYFYKSMTAHGNHQLWQDVYHVPFETDTQSGKLYVKFTSEVVTQFKLLSFKEKNS